MVDGATLARRAGSADRIVFLGHATVLIELNGVRLLTDPVLRDRVAHLRRQVAPVERSVLSTTTGPDAVLISHLHYDHLDLASLRLLGLDTRLLVPAGAGAWLEARGFTRVTELSVGDETVNIGALGVSAVEARHDGRRRPGPAGLRAVAQGYVVHGPARTVYFAGDTALFEGMSDLAPSLALGDGSGLHGARPERGPRPEIDRRSRPSSHPSPGVDVALLPVAGWGPTLGPGHMGPRDAARAAGLIRPRLAIPIHWGTLLPIGIDRRHRDHLGDPPRQFAEHVTSLAPGVEARILEPGEETAL
jgi:L-ascorbate metabolism protein UlaG (beta-lactamase superfamily)